MQRIRAEREKLTGPEIPGSETNTNEDLNQTQQGGQVQDIALQRAQTRVEGDKAAKG